MQQSKYFHILFQTTNNQHCSVVCRTHDVNCCYLMPRTGGYYYKRETFYTVKIVRVSTPVEFTCDSEDFNSFLNALQNNKSAEIEKFLKLPTNYLSTFNYNYIDLEPSIEFTNNQLWVDNQLNMIR